jgi:hypothetical protein
MSSMIFDALDERLPKGDIKMQGNHENKENKLLLIFMIVKRKKIKTWNHKNI